MALHIEKIEGDRARPVLVFLHHGLGSIAQWRDFPRRLCALTGCAGLVYDRQGHGQSPPLAAPRTVRYHFEESAALGRLLDAEGCSDVILIGHSDGGSIALLYPAVTGRQPHGIVTLAGHAFVESSTRAGIRAVMNGWRESIRSRLERFHGDKTDPLVLNWAGVWLSPSFDAFDIRPQLEAIRCPVLALQGERDEYGSVAQLDAIARAARAQRLAVPDCGHEPHTEAAAFTLAAISDWITRGMCPAANS